MNDGCGQISLKMAMDVAQCLGLTYIPSGFQARIGGSKGFWIVDPQGDSTQRWIEIYPSQTKWHRDHTTLDEKGHRTFEVLRWVQPLKPAALNLQFLPLLEDREMQEKSMRDAISRLLEKGLTFEIAKQRVAMDCPQSFRVWTNNLNSSIQDRLKHRQVHYEAGLPTTLEEKLNMLLDAGFDPKMLRFLKDLAWKAYSGKCELLKRKLNIAVGLSTYAYMAADFTGTLEPDEVYLCFSSNFKDELSGYSEVLLDGIDVLVARSPAHYASDIQRVRAVWKRELKPLKDVIIFSSRGDYPPAKKLSGGDYDGDIAWVCWEQTLVEPFRNAGQPECPDLEKLGHVTKDRTSYADLIAESPSNVTSVFLERSFDFNLQQSLLGTCTSFKECLCYTTNNIRDYDAVFLSTLLSYLVDQSKQGYIFTEEDWKKIKETVITTRPQKPAYKSDKFEGKVPTHIIDYLKFVVADKTIDTTLTDFHNSLLAAQYWDNDVIRYARWAEEQAKTSNDWKELLTKLKKDITVVKGLWSDQFREKDAREESKLNFASILHPLYEKWQAISPSPDASLLLTHMLLPPCLPNQDLSEWALLKASVAFASCSPKYVPNFVWWMCGRQLAFLKARFRDSSDGGGLVALTPQMHAMLKPNATYVKLLRAEEHEPQYWEARAESSVMADEEMGEDDD
jgi:RNA dependent RNA polymerase